MAPTKNTMDLGYIKVPSTLADGTIIFDRLYQRVTFNRPPDPVTGTYRMFPEIRTLSFETLLPTMPTTPTLTVTAPKRHWWESVPLTPAIETFHYRPMEHSIKRLKRLVREDLNAEWRSIQSIDNTIVRTICVRNGSVDPFETATAPEWDCQEQEEEQEQPPPEKATTLTKMTTANKPISNTNSWLPEPTDPHPWTKQRVLTNTPAPPPPSPSDSGTKQEKEPEPLEEQQPQPEEQPKGEKAKLTAPPLLAPPVGRLKRALTNAMKTVAQPKLQAIPPPPTTTDVMKNDEPPICKQHLVKTSDHESPDEGDQPMPKRAKQEKQRIQTRCYQKLSISHNRQRRNQQLQEQRQQPAHDDPATSACGQSLDSYSTPTENENNTDLATATEIQTVTRPNGNREQQTQQHRLWPMHRRTALTGTSESRRYLRWKTVNNPPQHLYYLAAEDQTIYEQARTPLTIENDGLFYGFIHIKRFSTKFKTLYRYVTDIKRVNSWTPIPGYPGLSIMTQSVPEHLHLPCIKSITSVNNAANSPVEPAH